MRVALPDVTFDGVRPSLLASDGMLQSFHVRDGVAPWSGDVLGLVANRNADLGTRLLKSGQLHEYVVAASARVDEGFRLRIALQLHSPRKARNAAATFPPEPALDVAFQRVEIPLPKGLLRPQVVPELAVIAPSAPPSPGLTHKPCNHRLIFALGLDQDRLEEQQTVEQLTSA